MPAALNPQSLPLHAHGVPNWVDLHTDRVDDARVFYEALLGWSFRNRFTLAAVPDLQVRDGQEAPGVGAGTVEAPTTVVAFCDDQPVAELVERNASYGDMALLSSWYPYVYVDDLQATLQLVEPAGGLIINPPAPRGADATVATILDPNDAMLCLWEPVGHPIASSQKPLGSFVWIELETPDLDVAKKFYGELFGWDAGEVSTKDNYGQGAEYTVFTKSGERVAGVIETAMPGIPASWCPSFCVRDVDQATITAGRNGGVPMDEPCDIPVGRQAVIVDPTGAAFSVLGPKISGPRPL